MIKDIEAAIVENTPNLQKLYRLAIASMGYKISFISSTSNEALETLRILEKKPDLLFFSSDNDDASINIIRSEFPDVIIKRITRDRSVPAQ